MTLSSILPTCFHLSVIIFKVGFWSKKLFYLLTHLATRITRLWLYTDVNKDFGFFKNRDFERTNLQGIFQSSHYIYYSDDNILYALGYIKASIKVWDFKNNFVPIKTTSIIQLNFSYKISRPSISSAREFWDGHGSLVK